jgi:hypothetical protein
MILNLNFSLIQAQFFFPIIPHRQIVELCLCTFSTLFFHAFNMCLKTTKHARGLKRNAFFFISEEKNVHFDETEVNQDDSFDTLVAGYLLLSSK